MAMMKARKAKRYAEGGAIYPDKSLTTYIPPGAGYVPGVSAEHLYFSKSPDSNSQSGPSPAQQAEMVQAAYSQYNQGGGGGGSGGGGGGPAGSAGDAGGPGGPGAPAASGADAAAASSDSSGDGAGTWAKGGAIKVKKMAKGGVVKSMSSRGDGKALRGKTKGRMV